MNPMNPMHPSRGSLWRVGGRGVYRASLALAALTWAVQRVAHAERHGFRRTGGPRHRARRELLSRGWL